MSVMMNLNPFDYFSDQNGASLTEGFVWIGEPNKDPRLYPVPIYFDAALTIPAAQPLRTNAGYIVRGNSPAFLFINGNYSILVQDKNGRQVFYVPDALLTGASGAVSLADLANSSDPLKGATLVGLYRGPNAQPNNNLGDYLRRTAIQLLEFIPEEEHAAILAGTSSYDASADVQKAIDYAASTGGSIVHDFGTVVVDCVILKQGLRGFFGNGTIKTNNVSTASGLGVLIVQGSFYGPGFTGIANLYLADLTIDCGGGSKRGFFGSSVVYSTITRLTVRNLDLTSSNSAIRLTWDCSDNTVSENKCFLPTITDLNTQACYGIHLVANDASFSGWGTGNIIPATNKNLRNTIINNRVFGGTHGISLTGSDENFITNNYLFNNAHRNIHLINSSANQVTINQCKESGSSCILMAYGSNDNNVVGNYCYSNQPGGESGIEIYVGSSGNNVEANRIRTGANYAIYIAISSNTNTVIANRIDCQVNKKAGIAIESDWMASPPAPYLFSRPNYGPPPPPRVNWPNGPISANVVKGNFIFNGNVGIAAIYISQIGAFASNILQYVEDNTIEATSFLYDYYYVEATSGLLAQQSLNNNTSGYAVTTKSFATRGRAHFNTVHGNDTFNGDHFFSVVNVSAPTVFPSDRLDISAYTAAVSVTDFSGGVEGQRIMVRFGPNITLIQSASIVLKGAGNLSGFNTNQYMEFLKINGGWLEMSRNF